MAMHLNFSFVMMYEFLYEWHLYVWHFLSYIGTEEKDICKLIQSKIEKIINKIE